MTAEGPGKQAEDAARTLLRTALERDGAQARLPATGFCMEPLIRDGDRVVVVGASSLEPGDVVLACPDADAVVCHRVLAVQRERVTLAGDRSSRTEELSRAEVLGVVVASSAAAGPCP